MRLKKELYKKEQGKIIDKIIDIIGLDDENSVTLYELDNNEEKQKKIMDLIPEIRKYFSYSYVRALMYPDETKRVYLSIIRQLTKQKYKMFSKEVRIKVDGEKVRTKLYTFVTNNTL